LRLRDLAGLIVIDFIDMDESRNNRTVERKLKDALKHDRARIQIGRISHFGLMEMSRQRIRSSVLESSTEKCPVCGGSGHVRSVSSVALQLLRAIEETLNKGATHNLIVRTRSEVALYVLNHKRAHLRMLEERFRITITISADATVNAQQGYMVDRGEQVHTPEAARALAQEMQPQLISAHEESEPEYTEEHAEEEETETETETKIEAAAEGEDQTETRESESDGEPRRRRRRRGRGRGREAHEEREPQQAASEAGELTHDTVAEHAIAHEDHDAGSSEEDESREAATQPQHGDEGDPRRRRRRGRRGGRRNRGRNGDMPHGEGAGPDADLQHAAEDMDGGSGVSAEPSIRAGEQPRAPTAEAEFPPPQQAPAPQREQAAPEPSPQAEAPPAEPPRRRSTIREAAPVATGQAPTPPASQPVAPRPEPVVSSTPPEPDSPKRGWWGRRLLGGN
jgi:ribonuclease E